MYTYPVAPVTDGAVLGLSSEFRPPGCKQSKVGLLQLDPLFFGGLVQSAIDVAMIRSRVSFDPQFQSTDGWLLTGQTTHQIPP